MISMSVFYTGVSDICLSYQIYFSKKPNLFFPFSDSKNIPDIITSDIAPTILVEVSSALAFPDMANVCTDISKNLQIKYVIKEDKTAFASLYDSNTGLLIFMPFNKLNICKWTHNPPYPAANDNAHSGQPFSTICRHAAVISITLVRK